MLLYLNYRKSGSLLLLQLLGSLHLGHGFSRNALTAVQKSQSAIRMFTVSNRQLTKTRSTGNE